MLIVHHSNRTEELLGALLEVIADPLPEPFAPEHIVVQSSGMGRWLAQQLALRTGIAANLAFPLPARFFAAVLRAWLPEAPGPEDFGCERLFWRLLKLLPPLLPQPAFAPLQSYLAAVAAGAAPAGVPASPSGAAAPAAAAADPGLCQLCRRIAELFDQYLVYRPERVLGWEEGRENHWQAVLWRAVAAAAGTGHRARLLAELLAAMEAGPPAAGALPARVSLFGLTALPPAYVRILGAVARHLPVHVFFLNPTQRCWGGVSAADATRPASASGAPPAGDQPAPGLEASAAAGEAQPAEEPGNPLLASLGRAGQVFWQQLQGLQPLEDRRFRQPPGTNLLAHVQRDLLDLRDPRRQPAAAPVAPQDRSIEVHVAATPLREVQILHDRLLALFGSLPGLEPRDVIVMAPEIGLYAPYVEAVFATAVPEQRLPFAIADRPPLASVPLLAAVDALLRLPRSRLEAGSVLSLLDVPAVQRRLHLDEQGLERIRTWVREAGIRWGADAAMRAELGLPAEAANTWSFGLDRLFVGYALPAAAADRPWAQTLPYADVEVEDLETLGALGDLLELLAHWRRTLRQPRSPAAWQGALAELLDDFFAPASDEDEDVLQLVRARLGQMAQHAAAAGFAGTLSLEGLRDELLRGLEGPGAPRFLTGGVTFCNMVPMRSIPFRVVALLGMNGTDFPRSVAPVSFDLLAQEPRPTDRARRRDDRYLFLEALLNARDALHISFVGRDARDHSLRVPSGVVSELLDYLDHGYRLADGGSLRSHVVVEHPLQPFSARYFDGSEPRLGGAAQHWLEAAQASPQAAPPPFAPARLPPPEGADPVVEAEELVRFLGNPARFFLENRLRLALPDEELPLDEAEPFDTTGLERYAVQQTIERLLEQGCGHEAVRAVLRGLGALPHGTVGELVATVELAAVEPFRQRVARHRAGAGALVHQALEFDLPVPLPAEAGSDPAAAGPASWRLRGRLAELRAGGCVRARLGRLRAKDRLAVWVYHLALHRLLPQGVRPRTVLVAADFTLVCAPLAPPQAAGWLADLLRLRWQGLSEPIPFYPESALALVEKGPDSSAFRQAWDGANGQGGEARGLAVRIAFRGRDPLGPEFAACAQRIFGPLAASSAVVRAADELPADELP